MSENQFKITNRAVFKVMLAALSEIMNPILLLFTEFKEIISQTLQFTGKKKKLRASQLRDLKHISNYSECSKKTKQKHGCF